MTLGLGVDECYGIGVSHDLDLSYFDHPPLIYWITHFSIPLLGDGRALRLPFVALFSGTSWLVFLFTRRLFGAVSGFWAVLSLNLSAFFTLAGGWIVPDGPLMFCLVGGGLQPVAGAVPDASGRASQAGVALVGTLAPSPVSGSGSPVSPNITSCCSSPGCCSIW